MLAPAAQIPGCGKAGKCKCGRGIWPQPQSSLFSCRVHGGIKKGVGVGHLLQGDALTLEHTACLYIRSENVPPKHLIPLHSFLVVLNSYIYICILPLAFYLEITSLTALLSTGLSGPFPLPLHTLGAQPSLRGAQAVTPNEAHIRFHLRWRVTLSQVPKGP